ncbi:hypothetical protein PIB30_013290 [Stylosanthes scabra]|uniref:Partial AB-hydrolase lipase domain-containing protein n=1 Tax=Stylosanthes scabra TaxID=79078 RepID=A0ABU6S6Y6_9FABA|nr:hypothetical protein [Stylosanthes scabra]
MSLLAIILCLLIFVAHYYELHGVAEASSRGSFGGKTGAAAFPAFPSDGICASSVIVHGYQCQELLVTTEDEYILSVQRIPEGKNNSGKRNNKQPVILQHGVLIDGRTWLLNSPEQNLPLILADNGFDVWIANTRGTTFSRGHKKMDPSQPPVQCITSIRRQQNMVLYDQIIPYLEAA